MGGSRCPGCSFAAAVVRHLLQLAANALATAIQHLAYAGAKLITHTHWQTYTRPPPAEEAPAPMLRRSSAQGRGATMHTALQQLPMQQHRRLSTHSCCKLTSADHQLPHRTPHPYPLTLRQADQLAHSTPSGGRRVQRKVGRSGLRHG